MTTANDKAHILARLKDSIVVDSGGQELQSGYGGPLQAGANVAGIKEDLTAVSAKLMTANFQSEMTGNEQGASEQLKSSESKSIMANLLSGEGRPVLDNMVDRIITAAIDRRDNPQLTEAAVSFVEMKAASNLMMSYDTLVGASDNLSFKLNRIEAKEITSEAKLGQSAATAMLYLNEIERNKKYIPEPQGFSAATLGEVTESLKSMSNASVTGMNVIHAQKSFQELINSTPLFESNVTPADKSEFIRKLDVISTEFKSTGADTKTILTAIDDVRSTVLDGGDKAKSSAAVTAVESATATVIVAQAVKTALDYAQGPEVKPFNEGLDNIVQTAVAKYETALEKLGMSDDAGKIIAALQVAIVASSEKMEGLLPGSNKVLSSGSDRYPRLSDPSDTVVFEPISNQKLQESGITQADVTGALGELKRAAIAEGRDPNRVDEFVAVQALMAREDVLNKNPEISKQFDNDNQKTQEGDKLSTERSQTREPETVAKMDSSIAKAEAEPKQFEAQREMVKSY